VKGIAFSGSATIPISVMDRIAAGRAHCAICSDDIRPWDDAFVTPDFLANENDPLWRFADVPVHRACFLVWDRRKSFIALYNLTARRSVLPDGSYLRMTSEGQLVWATSCIQCSPDALCFHGRPVRAQPLRPCPMPGSSRGKGGHTPGPVC
jgi:hypothetical protein